MKIEEKGQALVITDFNEMEAYKIACKIEKEGLEFYKKIAQNTEDEGIKKVIDFLIEEENKHLKFFQERILELRKVQEDTNEDNDILEAMDFGIFQPYESIEHLEQVLTSPDKALKLGLIAEEKSIRFYEACQQQVSSPSAKSGIAEIIEEERKHKDIIENHLNK